MMREIISTSGVSYSFTFLSKFHMYASDLGESPSEQLSVIGIFNNLVYGVLVLV